jgi:hypothetical protein
MSTSPSWFDQEKFSHLVKKVGKKSSAQSAASIRSAGARPVAREANQLLTSSQDRAAVEPISVPVAKKASQPLPKRESSVDDVIRAPADTPSDPVPVARSTRRRNLKRSIRKKIAPAPRKR